MWTRNFLIGAVSNTGNVKTTNQDNILVKIGEEKKGEFGLFAIADGMGGLSEGATASSIAINTFTEWWEKYLTVRLTEDRELSVEAVAEELDHMIRAANRKIISCGKHKGKNMGTTLSVLFAFGTKFIIRHIGDSRIYRINRTMGQITEDHTWVAHLVANGRMTREEAGNHPSRNILTQCLGISEDIELFKYMEEMTAKDIFLLCSDGFYNLLKEDEIIAAIYDSKRDKERSIQSVLERLLAKVKERGAADNASAILVAQCCQRTEKNYLSKIRDLILSADT